jgi:hypothetical protein
MFELVLPSVIASYFGFLIFSFVLRKGAFPNSGG